MAIITDSIPNLRFGKVDNIIVQRWKDLITARRYYGSYRVTHGEAITLYRSRFEFLMAEYKKNKVLIQEIYPVQEPYKFVWSQWISQQSPNVYWNGYIWQFTNDPYVMLLNQTGNKNEIISVNLTFPDFTTISVNRTAINSYLNDNYYCVVDVGARQSDLPRAVTLGNGEDNNPQEFKMYFGVPHNGSNLWVRVRFYQVSTDGLVYEAIRQFVNGTGQ